MNASALPSSELAELYRSHPLVAHAAGNLRRNLGARALSYAMIAVRRMRASGDEEGLAIWLALHAELCVGKSVPAITCH